MTNQEIEKQKLEKKIKEFEQLEKLKEIEELNKLTRDLVAQVQALREMNMINNIMANEYLSRLEKKYRKTLHDEQFKEYREQVINFNDDYITGRERLYTIRKTEKENAEQSMNEWKKEIEKTRANSIKTKKEGNENTKNKENERDEIRERKHGTY